MMIVLPAASLYPIPVFVGLAVGVLAGKLVDVDSTVAVNVGVSCDLAVAVGVRAR